MGLAFAVSRHGRKQHTDGFTHPQIRILAAGQFQEFQFFWGKNPCLLSFPFQTGQGIVIGEPFEIRFDHGSISIWLLRNLLKSTSGILGSKPSGKPGISGGIFGQQITARLINSDKGPKNALTSSRQNRQMMAAKPMPGPKGISRRR